MGSTCFDVCQTSAAGAAPLQADTADDDDDADRPVTAVAAVPPSPGSSTPSSSTAAVVAAARLPPTPRLRTRLFAAELLLTLFSAVGPDPRHKFPQPKYDEGKTADAAVAAEGSPAAAIAGSEPEGKDLVVLGLLVVVCGCTPGSTAGPAAQLGPKPFLGTVCLQHILHGHALHGHRLWICQHAVSVVAVDMLSHGMLYYQITPPHDSLCAGQLSS